MSHKFVAGAGLLVLAGWGISGLAVAGSDIKQVDLTLRILVDGPPPCSVKGSAVKFGNVGNDSNLLIVFYVQIMPDDFVMQLHRF